MLHKQEGFYKLLLSSTFTYKFTIQTSLNVKLLKLFYPIYIMFSFSFKDLKYVK